MKRVSELMTLKGRVALITGGAGHIGSVIGETLAELGANVVLLDIFKEPCFSVSEVISKEYDVDTLPLIVNLADEKEVKKISQKIIKNFKRLDILVNCAALGGASKLKGWTTSFEKQNTSTWRKALEINLTAPFLLTQLCAPALKKSGYGSVINISSTYGVIGPDMRLYKGTNMGNPAAYASSKGGLIQLTRWLATVLAPEIRVNAVTIGGVWRNQPEIFRKRYIERTPLRRMATEEDIKGIIAYLASDLSTYVTGQNIVVDGGWTIW